MTERSPRERLKEGDHLLTAGDYRGALDAYAEVAREYGTQGFTLKAVAVLKQMRTIIRERAPNEQTYDTETRKALVRLYRSIGFETDARAIEDE